MPACCRAAVDDCDLGLAEQRFANIVHWGEPERGGHFGAWEQPDRFVTEVRAAAAAMQSGSTQASEQAD